MSPKDSFYPKEILENFDEYLFDKGLTYEGIIVGGAAVSLVSSSRRFTQDIDVLTPITVDVKTASVDFAKANGLISEWFNNRVVNLQSSMPFGWGTDTIVVFRGKALILSSLSELNLLRTKVYVFIDRTEGPTIDLQDIKALNPKRENFEDACQWTVETFKTNNKKAKRAEVQEILVLLETLREEVFTLE